MKLVVVIPALNEEATLPTTLDELPDTVRGFDEIAVLVVDDGSTDRTSAVAAEHGVRKIVRFSQRRGLAEAFSAGIDAALALGADVIVTSDADNQYAGSGIGALVAPILDGSADIVVGERVGAGVAEFSRRKRSLQRLGSAAVRAASRTKVPDATSGFRAYSREAALRINVLGRFSYTLESLIQAGRTGLAVSSVVVQTNPQTRSSRLFSSTFEYIARSGSQMVRAYAMYEPLRTFLYLATVMFVGALVIFGRFVYFFATGSGNGHIQSLILGAILTLVAFQLAALGVIGDLLSANRRLLERVLVRVRRLELSEDAEHTTLDLEALERE